MFAKPFPNIFLASYILIVKLILSVVGQFYEAEVVSEYVIRGNAAVIKCNIPSFVADFVRVDSWLATDGTVFTYTQNYGRPNIFYNCRITIISPPPG